jgi:FkbM family methyltransferase
MKALTATSLKANIAAWSAPGFRRWLHYWPDGAVWRVCEKYIAWRLTASVDAVTVDGIKFRVCPSQGLGRSIFFRGEFEAALTSFFRRTLKEGTTFVDVGANLGYFALLASKLVGATGRVIAIEPIPANLQSLQLNRRLNPNAPENLEVVPLCVADVPGELEMWLPGDGGEASVCARKGGTCYVAKVSTLDDILSTRLRPHDDVVLKMDIEGAECLAVRGMASTLSGCAHLTLAIEIHGNAIPDVGGSAEELFDIMKKHGFRAGFLDKTEARPGACIEHPRMVIFSK